MRRKKLSLFIFMIFLGLILIISLGFVFACDDAQRIMRLSNVTNAHGEVWNGGGNYPVEICYNDIFGIEGEGDRTCSAGGENLILKLSDTTNAHACIKYASCNNLISSYPLDGNVIIDVIGGNNGTIVNGPDCTEEGKVGLACSFNGVDSYLEIPNDPSLQIGDEITLSAWVKRKRLNGLDIIMEKGGDWNNPGQTNYGMGLHNDPNLNYMFYFFFAGGWRGVDGVNDTKWHHYVVTAKNGSDNPKMYIDGELKEITYHYGGSKIILNANDNHNLHIGAQVNHDVNLYDYYSANIIDEVGIWNRSLSEREILELYNNGKISQRSQGDICSVNCPDDWVDVCYGNLECQAISSWSCGLLGQNYKNVVTISNDTNAHLMAGSYNSEDFADYLWEFENNFIDSKNNLELATYGNPEFINKEEGKAVKFDGIDDYLEINNDLGLGEEFIISLLINVSDIPYGTMPVFYLEGSENFNMTFRLFKLAGEQTYSPHLIINPPNSSTFGVVGNHITPNIWNKVSIIIENSDTNSTISIMVNKNKQTFIKNKISPEWVSPKLIIGKAQGAYFNGTIDNFAIYKQRVILSEEYPIKICCKSPPLISGNAYWADMAGNPITSAEIGDTVKMIVKNISGVNPGESVSFEIYEKDLLIDDEIRTGDQSISATIDANNSAIGLWKITQSDIDKTETGDLDGFYFKAKINNEEIESNELNVSDIGSNEPPTAHIISPEDRQIYFKDEILNFTFNASDKDDAFSWTFEENGVVFREGDNSDVSDFTYSFNSSGQKDIILKVIDERGKKTEDKISILIVNSSFVLAYIDEPSWGEVISGDGSVRFNASGSYAVEVSHQGNIITVECKGGACPEKTAGCPPGYNPSCSPKPECCQINVANHPGTSNWPGYSTLNFSWKIDGMQERAGPGGQGGGGDYVEFTKHFLRGGEHEAEVTVTEISSGINATGKTVFNVLLNSPFCSYSDTESNWIMPDGSIVNSLNNCNLGLSGLESCCPTIYDGCVEENNEWKCKVSSNEKSVCAHFNSSKYECENETTFAIAKYTITSMRGINNFCDGYSIFNQSTLCSDTVYNCRCVWNEENSTCDASWDVERDCGEDHNNIGNCTFIDTGTSSCLNGTITLSWIAVWNGTVDNPLKAECISGSRTIRCKPTIKLTFFTLFNLIIVIVVIFVIYFLWKNLKKTRKKQVKK